MGGQIAITLALQHPELFSHLILVAPAGFETFSLPEKQWISQFASGNILVSSQYFKWVLNLKNYFHELSNEEIEKLNELNRDFFSPAQNPYLTQVLTGSVKGMMDAPVFDRLPALSLPALIFFGKNDQLIPNRFLHTNLTSEAVARQGASQIAREQTGIV